MRRIDGEFACRSMLRLKTSYACGSRIPAAVRIGRVVRLGADIGLVCLGCGHRIMLPRGVLARRIKVFVQHGPRPTPEQLAHLQASEIADASAPAIAR